MSHRWHCSDWDCYIKSSRLSFPLHFHIDLYFRHGILYLLWTPDKSILSRAVSIWTNVVLRRCRSVHVILLSLYHVYVKTPLVASCLVVSAQSVTLLVRLPSLVIHTSLNALKCRSFPHFAEDCRLNFIWPGATKHFKHRVDAGGCQKQQQPQAHFLRFSSLLHVLCWLVDTAFPASCQ